MSLFGSKEGPSECLHSNSERRRLRIQLAVAEKLHSDVLERLQQDVVLSETARELVLAALLGEVEVCLGGKTPAAPATESAEPEDPARAYIDAVRVQGFRGIGPSAELALSPGPGLTLVVGRNGSGKSSFAEALELLVLCQNSALLK